MPWECCKMDERLQFAARGLDGEKLAVLCREFATRTRTGFSVFAHRVPHDRDRK
jgi:hypothetical protein